jgi:cell division transport system permease protein
MNLSFSLRLTAQNLRSNLALHAVSVAIISLAFLILGVFLLVATNLGKVIERWGESIQISAYLKDNLDPGQRDAVYRQLLTFKEIKQAEYVSREQALRRFKSMLRGEADLLEGLGENPLPASFEIHLAPGFRSLEQVESVAGQVAKLPSVKEVEYGREWLKNFTALLRLVKLAGSVVGVLIFAAALFIISNTIKLTVYSRRDEIGIMKLVGASDFTIRLPFLIEGVTAGTAAASLALLLLWLLFLLLARQLGLPDFVSFLPPSLCAALILAGAGLGIFGSSVSFSEFLRV